MSVYTYSKAEPFRKYVVSSLIGHALLLLVLSLKIYLDKQEVPDLSSAIRVDMVALPDKLTQEEAPVAAQPAAPPTTVPIQTQKKEELPTKVKSKPVLDPNPINLQKTKEKQKDALARLKKLQAMEELERQVEAENKRKAALEKLKQSSYKGNVISTGGDVTGAAKLQRDNYISEVDRHLRSHWSLPEYLKKRNLIAEVLLRIDERGNVTSKELVKSSGNPVYDEAVMLAVQQSSPVPPPPAKFTRLFSNEGFLIRFIE